MTQAYRDAKRAEALRKNKNKERRIGRAVQVVVLVVFAGLTLWAYAGMRSCSAALDPGRISIIATAGSLEECMSMHLNLAKTAHRRRDGVAVSDANIPRSHIRVELEHDAPDHVYGAIKIYGHAYQFGCSVKATGLSGATWQVYRVY